MIQDFDIRKAFDEKQKQAESLLALVGTKKTEHNFSVYMSLLALAMLAGEYFLGLGTVINAALVASPLLVDVLKKGYNLVKGSQTDVTPTL
jgi:hypothetical protein